MSLNTSYTSNGVLMHCNEYILLYVQKVTIKFFAPRNKAFEGSKNGCIYMTSHRLIFNNASVGDLLQSFSAPYIALYNIDVLHPSSSKPYLVCSLKAQPNGNFNGEVKLKISLDMGDISTFGEAVKKACKLTKENAGLLNESQKYNMEPYSPGDGWTKASFNAFKRPPGYYEWVPEQREFSEVPINFVFITQDSPSFPGIGAPPRYEPENFHVPRSQKVACAKAKFDSNEKSRVPTSTKGCVDTNLWEIEEPSEPTISDF